MSSDDRSAKPRKAVGAVAQAFRILRVLSTTRVPQGVSWVAREAQVNPSTAFNILRTLVTEDAAEFDEIGKTYKLGRGLLKISRKLIEQSIVEEIRVELDLLASETQCLVGLWEAHDGRMTLLERATGGRGMRLDMEIKQRLPFLAGALGRAHAAQLKLSDAELRQHFQNLRWEGDIDAKHFIAEVREAETKGYAVDREQLYLGVVSIGTVMTNREGVVLYGLTASDIAHKLDQDRIGSLGEEMTRIGKAFLLT